MRDKFSGHKGDAKMKIAKMSVAALALMSSMSVVTAKVAYAVPVSTAALSVPANDDKKDWLTTLAQEVEGTPNPDRHGRCVLISRPVADVHGHFIGYHTFNVCS
jgi:hypothetical protein